MPDTAPIAPSAPTGTRRHAEDGLAGTRRPGRPPHGLPQSPATRPRRRIIALLLLAAIALGLLLLTAAVVWPALLQPLHPDGRPRQILTLNNAPGGGPGP